MINALKNLMGIGRVTVVDDSGELQTMQITEGAAGSGFQDRVTDAVRRVCEFGFTSVPPIDAEALVLNRSGNRSKPVVIATSHRPSRPKNLQPGDAGIYDVRGAKVMLTENGLVIDCAGLPAIIQNATTVTIKGSDKVTIDAPTAEILHDLTVGGTIHAAGNIASDAQVSGASMHSTGNIVSDGEVTAGPANLTVLRTAYGAHKHGGVKAGTDTSGATDHAA